MPYESVDRLQKVLSETIFADRQDCKKAAGRALGVLVEVITFYLLKSWGFEKSISIERPLPEFGNAAITHNVEYSLHPILQEFDFAVSRVKLPLKSTHLFAELGAVGMDLRSFTPEAHTLLSSKRILRNSCHLARGPHSYLVATMKTDDFNADPLIAITEQFRRPFAIFECKRVGVEEGMKKGPQTIEKAKQGAYVAKTVSSLHKLRMLHGELQGLIYRSDGTIHTAPYEALVSEIVASQEPDLLSHFVMTVGLVSNHGNWFTSENHNKELKVLAQSYDWLLFLSDHGLAQFITDLLLAPVPGLDAARNAFLASNSAAKTVNSFTKVSMDYSADRVLEQYFAANRDVIESWFNVISPTGHSIAELRMQLSELRQKNWKEIHQL
jgi:hypothetical protein